MRSFGQVMGAICPGLIGLYLLCKTGDTGFFGQFIGGWACLIGTVFVYSCIAKAYTEKSDSAE